MRILLICITVMLSNFLFAQEKSTLTVLVENIPNNKGEVLMGVFTENTFMKAAPNYSESLPITNNKVKFVFENVENGTYAASCFQDSNGNQTMDFEANGMPKESYGVSNNKMLMGPPTWEESKFDVKRDTTIHIIM